MRRFASYWDLVSNSGRFTYTRPLLLAGDSPFSRFLVFTDWLHAQVGQTHSIAFRRLIGLLFTYLTDERDLDPTEVASALVRDHWRVTGKPHIPTILAPHVEQVQLPPRPRARGLPARQRRHLPVGVSQDC